MNYRGFFLALINLLYSVSKSDKEVHLLEVQKILDIIERDIIHIFPDLPKNFQVINKELIQDELKRLYIQQKTEEEAYDYFMQFYLNNKRDFNLDINLLCYQLTVKVAYSHKGINEEEILFLKKLKKDLEVD